MGPARFSLRAFRGRPAAGLPLPVVVVLLAALVTPSAPAQVPEEQGQGDRELAIKAAYLYNFSRYVTWPARQASDQPPPFVIGVFGREAVAAYLEAVAEQGKSVAGRSIVVRRGRTADDCNGCELVFLGSSTTAELREEITRRLGEKAVLLVGETAGFAEQGGIINFYLAENRVRFEINLPEAERRGLKISARLLSLARMVPGPDSGRSQ